MREKAKSRWRTVGWLGVAACLAFVALLGSCGGGDCEEPAWALCETDTDCAVVYCGCCPGALATAVREECADSWRDAHGCDPAQICLMWGTCPVHTVACQAGRCVVQ